MTSRYRLVSLLNSASSSNDVVSKFEILRQFDHILTQQGQVLQNDDVDSLFSELLPRLFELQSDDHSPVRKIVARIIGEIGLRHLEFVPEIVPVLMGVLEDRTPAVARQAIASGIDLFRFTLQKIAMQGLHTSELDDMLKSSWSSMLEFKEKILSMALQPGSGGVRLLALKFVESVILLYTPDPSLTPEPPTHEGKLKEFNISWIHGRHPILNVGDLSIEASKRLSLLLDQLRFPTVKSLSNLVIIVLVNSLATIAKKRPPYYGRILPVLLGLYSFNSNIEGMRLSGTCHALKNAFLICLKCTHPGAAPWRDRLLGALRGMKAEELAEEFLQETLKNNRRIEESKEEFLLVKEEKPCANLSDDINNNLGRKRSGVEDSGDLAEENGVSRKRVVRQTPSSSEESTKDSVRNMKDSEGDNLSSRVAGNKVDDDNGPVQQLVAMFGALVAQGEKAIGSLEILIAGISADLLAEVVMANMRYLPTNEPQAEGHDEMLANMTIVGSDSHAKYPSSFLAHVYSLSSSFPPVASKLYAHESVYNDMATSQGGEQLHAAGEVHVSVDHDTPSHETEINLSPATLPLSNIKFPGLDMDGVAMSSDVHDVGGLENEIPGLDSSAHNDRLSETMDASSLVSTDLENASQEQATSFGAGSSQDMLPVSTDRSEELSSFATAVDSSSIISSTATQAVLPSTIVLPKMSAPVVNLGDEEKDQLQSLAFTRIVEAYKQVIVSGGSDIRFSLIANLGVEFPSELEPWPMLQMHILSDYVGHEGHELTLRVLYRLFSEMEAERDFFSSTAASSVYEMFILTVAETLRDSFPPSDKSLSKLLGEAPYLPKSILKLLEMLCSPGNSDKPEKDMQSGDRVTQGLSTVWNLIMLRPPIREVCLKIALQSAVHHLEEFRMKAIRLVANKLYPLSFIARQIEDFAMEMLMSSANDDAKESMNTDGPVTELQKDSNLDKSSNEYQPVSDGSKDLNSDAHQPSLAESISPDSIAEAQRCLSLYFALCTKKHSIFRQIFVVYGSASKSVKQAVHRHIPILVRTMGSSPGLLEIISDPPNGSENLLMQVLQTLTDGTLPSPDLVSTVRKLFESRLKDAEILIPILPFLSRDEILPIFPHLVNLSLDKFQAALNCILQGSSRSAPVLTPAEVLIAIHGIDPDRDGIPLKKVTDACNACFEQRQVFTQQVLAKVLNQLVEQIPLPLLFMRTVLQAIGAFPGLVDFIMEILSRLISKQIWKYPKLWVGFLKCAQLTKPQSFSVLLQLPPPQLENALNRIAALRAPLTSHASQPNIKSSLPRSVLVVLGIASDSQTASQAQASQTQTETQSPSQAQASQSQTVDTANSDKEVQTEISKDSSVAS